MPGGVKGTAVASVVEDMKRLIEAGRLRRDELEVRLEPADLDLLEQKILPSTWYPLGVQGRLTQILLEVEGKGSLEYLLERGRRAAERMREGGLYAQLAVDQDRWGDRIGALMIPLGPAIYRDTVWSIELSGVGSEMRFEIAVEVQEDFPEVCRHQTQGFIEHASSYASGRRVRMSSERVKPTLIKFIGQGTR